MLKLFSPKNVADEGVNNDFNEVKYTLPDADGRRDLEVSPRFHNTEWMDLALSTPSAATKHFKPF